MKKQVQYQCPVEAALGLIGGKYKAVILYHLMEHTLRFSELQKIVVNATPKMLTQQLRELEADGIVARTVYPVVPPKTEYALTDFGKTLIPVIQTICQWSETYVWDKYKKNNTTTEDELNA